MEDIDCSAGMRRMMARCGRGLATEEEEEEEEEGSPEEDARA
jgi:hypothetical protein